MFTIVKYVELVFPSEFWDDDEELNQTIKYGSSREDVVNALIDKVASAVLGAALKFVMLTDSCVKDVIKTMPPYEPGKVACVKGCMALILQALDLYSEEWKKNPDVILCRMRLVSALMDRPAFLEDVPSSVMDKLLLPPGVPGGVKRPAAAEAADAPAKKAKADVL